MPDPLKLKLTLTLAVKVTTTKDDTLDAYVTLLDCNLRSEDKLNVISWLLSK